MIMAVVLNKSVKSFLSLGKIYVKLTFLYYGLDLESKHFIISNNSEFIRDNIVSQDRANALKWLRNCLLELIMNLFYLYLEISK